MSLRGALYMSREISNLEQMLDRIDQAGDDRERISVGLIVQAVGSRSFGPLLLLAGVVLVSPLSGIPGMPTTMAVLVLLIAGQLLLRKPCCWLPRWLLKRSMLRSKLGKALEWLRPPARFIDRWLRPRLGVFIGGVALYVIAIACIAIAAGMPIMELIPFSATAAGVALAAFGLSLISHDGLLALLAFLATGVTLGLVVSRLL
jgi:hypothetical protein